MALESKIGGTTKNFKPAHISSEQRLLRWKHESFIWTLNGSEERNPSHERAIVQIRDKGLHTQSLNCTAMDPDKHDQLEKKSSHKTVDLG